MIEKRRLIFVMVFLVLFASKSSAQRTSFDDLFINGDTTAVLDSLMKDFEDYLDSVNGRKSFFAASVTAGTSLFSFENSNNTYFTTERKFLFSPSLSYFHKSGFGINTAAYVIKDGKTFNPFQYSISPSFDYLKRKYSTGVSYTRYFVKDSLQFYTTPIQQEAFAYFTYKDFLIKPSISVAYGWGSTTSFEKKKIKIKKNRAKNSRINVTEIREESLHDLSVVLSVKKDFNFFDVLRERDMISLTPVLLINCGTQQYGFNSSYSYTKSSSLKSGSLPSNVSITDRSSFSPQTAAVIMRASYLSGRVLIQPQIIMDYFIPGTEQQLNTAFSVTAGVTF